MKSVLYSLFALFFTSMLASCASRTLPTSGNYNNYNEDLSAARPSYNTVGLAPASTIPRPVPATTTPTPANTEKPTRITQPAGQTTEPLHINKRLDLVLETMANNNRSIRYAPGYRIQVYVGNERQQAEATKLLIYQNFPELNPYLVYKQPTYRLKVGDFMRRMDAERYYSQIRQWIASAVLQPDKVEIRRGLVVK
jgi:hypothetical protein